MCKDAFLSIYNTSSYCYSFELKMGSMRCIDIEEFLIMYWWINWCYFVGIRVKPKKKLSPYRQIYPFFRSWANNPIGIIVTLFSNVNESIICHTKSQRRLFRIFALVLKFLETDRRDCSLWKTLPREADSEGQIWIKVL